MSGATGIIRSGTASFFDWWLGELAGMVPARLRMPFSGGGRTLVFHAGGKATIVSRVSNGTSTELGRIDTAGRGANEQRVALRRMLGRISPDGETVVLRLPAHQVLRKRVSFPAEVEDDLDRIIFFEIDRQTPFSHDEVYFAHRVVGRDVDAGEITVEFVVCPRETVDAAVELVSGWGVRPDAVDFEGAGEDGMADIDLLPVEQAAKQAPAGRRFSASLAGLAIILAAVAASMVLDRQQQRAEELVRMVSEARAAAGATVELREEVERLAATSSYLIDLRRNTPTTIGILAELTRLVPDGTWLMRSRIDGGRVTITGYSPSAANLIGDIEASPLFVRTSFSSPITRDPRLDLERFNLSTELDVEEGE
jgi:general secretion pathway protein L